MLSGAKRLALLCYLLLARPRGLHRRDTLLAMLWPDSDQHHARGALRSMLHLLRVDLGPDVIARRGDDEIGIPEGTLWCDAVAFERALAEGDLATALELYRGDLLEGFHATGVGPAFGQWLDEERSRLRRLAAEGAWSLSAEAERAGNPAAAARWARRAAAVGPRLDEPAHRRLIETLARAGDRTGAVRAFDEFAERVRAELEMEPSDEMRALIASLRSGRRGRGPGVVETPARSRAPHPAGPASRPTPSEGASLIARADAKPMSGRRQRYRRMAVASVVLFLAGVVGGWWAHDRPARPGDGAHSRIAVLPFAVRGGERFAYLGEGLATVLGTNLGGPGRVTAVDPQAVLSLAPRDARHPVAAADAAALAERLGAGLYVLGDVVGAGDRVRIVARLYTRGREEPLTRASVDGAEEDLLDLADELTALLLSGNAAGPASALLSVAANATSSLDAFKAYLQAEADFRDGRLDRAVSAYREAVERDPEFALAYHRLSVTAEWLGEPRVAQEAAERAVLHADRLPDRRRRLLDAHLASIGGDAPAAERLYRSVLARYPHDAEAWYQLGEILFHYGPAAGRSLGEARAAFGRVLDLSPTHVPSLVHVARIAAADADGAALDSLRDRILAREPGEAHGWEVRALHAVVGDDPAERQRVRAALARGSDEALRRAVWSVAVFAGDLDEAERLARLMTSERRAPATRATARAWLTDLALARGRPIEALREVHRVARSEAGPVLQRCAIAAALPFLDLDTARIREIRGELLRWDAGPRTAGRNPEYERLRPLLRQYLLGLLEARLGDDAAALEAARALDEDPGAAGPSLARVVRATAARAGGRVHEALDLLGPERLETPVALIGGLDYAQPHERFIRAELLFDLGNDAEALRSYGSFSGQHIQHLVYLAPSHLRRATIHERRGEPQRAAAHYRHFLELWRDPEPRLRPLADAARKRLAVLDE